MYKVGITGGIGSGKSTVCRMFAELGVAVYDSHADMCMINIDLDELREEVAQCDNKLRYRAARYGDRS